MSDPLLIVGADGLLGGALREFWRTTGRSFLATSRRPQPGGAALTVDLSSPPASWAPLPPCHAAALCAAVTSLDRCRRDPVGTRLINVVRTLELAERLAANGAFIVFLSSNLVFDGISPLVQDGSPTRPQTEYGRQKAEVEKSLSERYPNSAIIRLTKVLDTRIALFQKWMNELEAGRSITAYTNYHCAPISLTSTVQGIARISENRLPGIWQFSGPSDVSYYEIALDLARVCSLNSDLVQPVQRPREDNDQGGDNTSLDATRARKELGLNFPPMREIMESMFHAEGSKRG